MMFMILILFVRSHPETLLMLNNIVVQLYFVNNMWGFCIVFLMISSVSGDAGDARHRHRQMDHSRSESQSTQHPHYYFQFV